MKKKKRKCSKPMVHRPDGDWITPLQDKRLKKVINSAVLKVSLVERMEDSKSQYAKYKVLIDNHTHLMDIKLIRGNTRVSMEFTATSELIEASENKELQKSVVQEFPYPSKCVLELYDAEKNLLLSREAERVCRAIRVDSIEIRSVIKSVNMVETHFAFQGKEYISYSDIYFNPKRDFACLYLDVLSFAELAIFHLSESALKEIQSRFAKEVEKPKAAEVGLIEKMIGCNPKQYVIIKDTDWCDLLAGEAEYVARILREGTGKVIDETKLDDEFGSVQKLMLCGDKLCFISAETTFVPSEAFCYDCVDIIDGEVYTALYEED